MQHPKVLGRGAGFGARTIQTIMMELTQVVKCFITTNKNSERKTMTKLDANILEHLTLTVDVDSVIEGIIREKLDYALHELVEDRVSKISSERIDKFLQTKKAQKLINDKLYIGLQGADIWEVCEDQLYSSLSDFLRNEVSLQLVTKGK